MPAVGGSNPSVPAIKTERPKPITAQGAFLWASGGIRTRKGAELRKREAFSSAARKERSDAAGRGRRPGGRGIPPSRTSQEPLTSSKSSQRRQAEGSEPARMRSDAAARGRRRQTRCRHLGTFLKCQLGTIFEDPPKDCGQNTANMSTVTVVATFILFIKEAPNEIHSHQEPLLLNIWGTLTVLTLKTSVKWSVKRSKTLLLIR